MLGWRPGKHEGTVGSLILGLYGRTACSSPSATRPACRRRRRRSSWSASRPTRPASTARADPSRWDGDRELEWRGLRPELVVEIAYDTKSPGRIRHGTRILRWRTDKAPRECTIDQLI